ncbi:orotidine-5'-phosphate decarboxylase, partial [Oscillospiraceae bacterium OttesenSCG-928-G22]|nr:orotidine-5'-phosphate decarboxylase [Oscillospiraceae bacterium OttesenSCG-928-G22]
LKKTVDYAREKGLYVVVDGKRNDIGSTAEAYADAYLGKVKVGSKEYSAFETDALIVSAYLGSDGIKPFLKLCADNGKGMFVLVKTSNPSSIEIQDMIAGDRPFYRVVASYCERWGKPYVGKYGFSTLGAVVGATFPQQLKELRKAHPSLFFLVPGYGAQGGSAADVAGAFNAEGLGAVINSSRGIMCAYQNKGIDGTFYAEAALDACITMRDELRQFIPMA